jgi:hypothetical protein
VSVRGREPGLHSAEQDAHHQPDEQDVTDHLTRRQRTSKFRAREISPNPTVVNTVTVKYAASKRVIGCEKAFEVVRSIR